MIPSLQDLLVLERPIPYGKSWEKEAASIYYPKGTVVVHQGMTRYGKGEVSHRDVTLRPIFTEEIVNQIKFFNKVTGRRFVLTRRIQAEVKDLSLFLYFKELSDEWQQAILNHQRVLRLPSQGSLHHIFASCSPMSPKTRRKPQQRPTKLSEVKDG